MIDPATVLSTAEPFTESGVAKVRYRGGGAPRTRDIADADPITTEVIRHGLTSAADQMKRALMRTAYSAVIYEVLDFATALYDRDVRMLAQGHGLPIFVGTLHFCVEAAVEAVGGENALDDGDIILYNDPFGTGSHMQDGALVAPIFYDGDLVGYAAIKAHWLDIGATEPYCTDTRDVLQEGTVFPGVKLFRKGELVDDIYRVVLANSRFPRMLAGDINAEVVGLRTGIRSMLRLIERYGLDEFQVAVERMFDHGEAVVRSYFEKIPDGRYIGHGVIDSSGVSDLEVPFDVVVEVDGSDVRVDYSLVPDALDGPMNTPVAGMVSVARVAIGTIAGGLEAPNEGHFRPLEVVSRPGSLFHPLPPSPSFLASWPASQAIEVIYQALARALPQSVPASSGGDICVLVWWGSRVNSGEAWGDGFPTPIGQGAHANGDGASALMHLAAATTRLPGAEVWEAKYPWLIDKLELAADSGGPGRHRGGLGLDISFRMLEPAFVTSAIERTKNAPWGLEGGLEARPNSGWYVANVGEPRWAAKETAILVAPEERFDMHTGGGGGFGPPAERDPATVHADVREGYTTEAHARKFYPHAFE